jgi:hypothetical protein
MFNIHDFYCRKCKEVRPHEMSEDGQKARCITCQQSQRQLALDRAEYNDDARHFAALDGAGNRGEPLPPIQLRAKIVAMIDRALKGETK